MTKTFLWNLLFVSIYGTIHGRQKYTKYLPSYLSNVQSRAVPWLRRLVAASHRGGPGSIPGQSIWDLWWTKWHWDRIFPEFFGFPLSMSFHWWSITRKRTTNNIIFTFITGLQNKPQGCGASVASAAGPFKCSLFPTYGWSAAERSGKTVHKEGCSWSN
jgi:hypothetical protein